MSNPFVYSASIQDLGVIGTHVAIVPVGISDRDQLFDHLVGALRLPKYFGRNWDAFDECLRDLSWISAHRVVLFHEAMPELGDDALTTYLEILRDAVLDWRVDADDELVVAFPPATVTRVARLAG